MSVPPGTLVLNGSPNGLTTQINIHPEHSETRLQEGQYESSVPLLADRIVQAAVQDRAGAESSRRTSCRASYGFRPGRRAQDAIAEIHFFGTRGYRWVLDADIEAAFDNVSHRP